MAQSISDDQVLKYTKSSLSFTQQVETLENTAKQIDFWIICEGAMCGESLHKFIKDKETKQEMVQTYLPQQLSLNNNNNDNVDDDDDDNKFEQGLLELNMSIIYNETIVDCADIFDSNFLNNDYLPSHLKPIWDLQSFAKQIGFTQNINYWYQYAKHDEKKLNDQFHEMYNFANKNCNGYQHYLFIIDRRNPENVKHKNMHFIKSNYMKTSQNWKDKIYLFVGDMIYNNCKQQPKSPNVYCTDNLFPNNDSIKLNDELNGYKFILSYHLSEHSVSDKYWYVDGKLERFKFSELTDLWNEYFV